MTSPKDLHGDVTARLAGLFAARISAARAELNRDMTARGLGAAAGWRIHEEMVNTPNGLAMRLRAIHSTQNSPEGLEKLVSLA